MLVTQFAVPRLPPGMIARPRLEQRLRAALELPVTLVCAGAGSGKTALVAAHARGEQRRVAWVSLEPGDTDLWGAVLTALELDAPVHDPAFMTLLVNALAELPDPVVLVLDDVQLLRSRTCLAQLAFLVLHAPATLRLVLISRSDPPLPLHGLRLRGRLGEIRAADLAFTADEAGALLREHGLELSDELVAALHERTEGWAAGLRLAALSLRQHADPERFVAEFAGDDRAVGDYLVAEVLDHEPPRMREFLLRTAIADRICGGLADALTGGTGGADTLAALERANGFVIGLDAHREWFRYHGLFATLLRARAAREFELEPLHARAARWHAEHGTPADALRHAVAAADWDLVAELVAGRGIDLYASGDAAAVRALVPNLPLTAELSAALACAALEAGDTVAADELLTTAASGVVHEPRHAELLVFARLARARLEGDLPAARDAAAALPDSAVVRALVGEAAMWGGELDVAAHELRAAVEFARRERVKTSALGCLALAEVQRGGTLAGIAPPDTACGHAALALAALYELDADDARAHLERAYAAAATVRRHPIAFVLAEISIRLRLATGERRRALAVLDDHVLLHGRGPTPLYERIALPGLRARLAGDEPHGAATVELLTGLPPSPYAFDRVERAVRIALGHDEDRRPADASRALEHALDLAAQTRISWPFVEAGSRIEPLLRRHQHAPTAHTRLLGELLAGRPGRDAAPPAEPLSAREQTLLGYLPTQLSNQEIAAELFITTNTVKTHLRSIYRKLGVDGRREAVARARELRL